MLEFLKKWFSVTSRRNRDTVKSPDPTLDLGPDIPAASIRHPEADVHQLMIKATGIRKKKGYDAAVQFLKELADIYLQQESTALVTCINKLIPYMKRASGESPESTYTYLNGILERLPDTDPYFLNLHITMAELIENRDRAEAIRYLEDFLSGHPPSVDTHYHLIKLADFYGSAGNIQKAREYLSLAKSFWDTRLNRTVLIRMQRRWFRTSARVSSLGKSRKDQSEYLVSRFLEFALDMARILDPAQIDDFHKRKDQYFKKVRGFENHETFLSVIDFLNIQNRKHDMIRKIYGYVFEEMPLILGVTEKQLNYRPGDPESIEEVRGKKIFSEKPFTELHSIETDIRQIVDSYTL